MVNLDRRPSRNPVVVGRVVDNEAVLVIPDQGQVKVVNALGARIWDLVDGQRSVREIAAQICREYQVDERQAEQDVFDFLSALTERGVVQFSE